MTMLRCVDCSENCHIGSEFWVYTFEDVEAPEGFTTEEVGLCEGCFEKGKSNFIEKLLTGEQLKELEKFETKEFERFEKEVVRRKRTGFSRCEVV